MKKKYDYYLIIFGSIFFVFCCRIEMMAGDYMNKVVDAHEDVQQIKLLTQSIKNNPIILSSLTVDFSGLSE